MGAVYQIGAIRKVLIVSPASVCSVWEKELCETAAFPFTCKVMFGGKKARLKALSDLEKQCCQKLKVAVINIESVWRDGIFEALQGYDADLIVCDESQRIKTHNAKQSKAMHRLGDMAKYKLILSGTPVQNNAIDIWSQYRFLDRTVFGDSYYAFRERYAVMGGFNNKQITGYRDMDELVRKEHSIAFRITKEEAVDLPEQTFEVRYVGMPAKERKLYEKIRKDSITELESGGKVTAATVLTKLLRLQQLAGGFLVKDGADKPEKVSTAKLDALKDIIIDYVVEGSRKLVVFARFIPEVNAILKLAEKILPKNRKAVALYGGIKKNERGGIVGQFQTDPDTVLFVGQIDTAGTGITLTAADTCVYYSKNFNYATYEQSLSRIHRIGQVNRCTYIDLVVGDSVDEKINIALRKKENLAETVVDNWKQYF